MQYMHFYQVTTIKEVKEIMGDPLHVHDLLYGC